MISDIGKVEEKNNNNTICNTFFELRYMHFFQKKKVISYLILKNNLGGVFNLKLVRF